MAKKEIRYSMGNGQWTIWADCTQALAREYKNSEIAQVREKTSDVSGRRLTDEQIAHLFGQTNER